MKDKLLSIVINILATEIESKSKYDDPTPHCPNCGAKMDEVET